MLSSFVILVIAGALFELCNAWRRQIFKARVKRILKGGPHMRRHADPSLFSGLPDPVYRYLKKVLPDDLPVIATARLRHDGYFRTGLNKRWTKIRGEQYFKGTRPGFVWKGQTLLFTAVDSYVKNAGNLSVWLLSALRIADKHGPEIDDGEILRWLAESALFPSNLIPSGKLKWEAVDTNTARLVYTWRRKKYILLFHFNLHNEIDRVETERPFNGKGMEKWVGKFSDYKKAEGYRIPLMLEACWIIDGVEKPYARFRVTTIEYNVKDRFR